MPPSASRIDSSPRLRSSRDHSSLKTPKEGSRAPLSPTLSIGTARPESKQKRDKSLSLSGSQHSENSGSRKVLKAPQEEDIEEIVRKQVEKASQLRQKETEPYGFNIFNSPLFKEITFHRFAKKFVMSSFECYSGATDPI